MQIGALNKRITLQYATKVSDAMGSFTETWTDAATIWAAIWPTTGTELVESLQTGMVTSHRIRIRYRSVLRPSWRIKFGYRYFNIVSIVNPSEKNEWLDIMAKEAV